MVKCYKLVIYKLQLSFETVQTKTLMKVTNDSVKEIQRIEILELYERSFKQVSFMTCFRSRS